jgi:hypothetical protein
MIEIRINDIDAYARTDRRAFDLLITVEHTVL